MRVLVAVEDRLFGSAIALFVSHHQWPEDTQFRVVNIVEPLPCSSARAFGHTLVENATSEIVEEASRLVDEVAATIQNAFPKASVIPQVIEGYAQDELLDIADDWQPDLIVAGSHGRMGFNQLFMGSTSLSLASESPYPIMFIRPDARTLKLWTSVDHKTANARELIEQTLKDVYRDTPIGKILVAIDDTELADEVIDFIRKHYWDEPCRFKILRVYQTPSYLRFLSKEDLKQIDQDAIQEHAKSLRRQALKLRSFFHSPRVEEELVEGDPKTMIVKVAKEWEAELIIVGGHINHAKYPYFGSVSLSVMSSAPCSVLLLRQQLTQKVKQTSKLSPINATT